MVRLLASALIAVLALSGCRRDRDTPTETQEAPSRPASPASKQEPAPPDAPARQVGRALDRGGEPLGLELRHRPAEAEGGSVLSMVLLESHFEWVLWEGQVDAARLAEAWSAEWALAVDPAGGRLGISRDGGASFGAAFQLEEGWTYCPHEEVAARDGQPDWARMPEPERWAAGVLETAVWGCDAEGRGCASRSLAAMPVHHSAPGDQLLWLAHEHEVMPAVGVARRVRLTRPLAAALVDAALGYQRGLDEAQLRLLGTVAARAFADDGPLGAEERRALALRVVMARAELKKTATTQPSPGQSIEALSAAMELRPAPPNR